MPALARDVEFSCGRGRFVSVVRAVCHTQLGNQLSAYAALLYFTARHGYHAVLDPFQLKIIGAVFRRVETVNCDCDYVKIMSAILRTDKLSIGALSFSQCRCGGARWVRPLQLRTTHGRTRLATGLRPGWDPSKHASNTLVDLGPFSVPVFLIKGILTLELESVS